MWNLTNALINSADWQLDRSIVEVVKEWNDPPTSKEVLDVLKVCREKSLAKPFIITMLEVMYEIRFNTEKQLLK